MNISVLEPVGPAIQRTREILFRPFELEKWLALGFCAWLANLGSGGGSFSVQVPSGGGVGGGPGGPGTNFNDMMRNAMDWVRDHLAFVLAGALCVFVAITLFGLLLTWLRCRGDFMFLDGVARNRGAVRAPWTEYRDQANSLFWFRFLFSMAVSLLSIVSVALGALVALGDIQRQEFGPLAAVGILLSVSLMMVTGITAGCVSVLLGDLVVPIMYQRRIGVMDGWREFDRLLFFDHKGTLVVYLLFRIVMGFVTSLLAVFATCCTCCLAALPFVGTVILLPLYVFARSYTLYFLAQFGPESNAFAVETPERPTS